MKRKEIQRLAAELVDAIDALRSDMAMQDAVIQRQAAQFVELRAAGDALAEALTLDLCDCENKDCTALRNAHRRWQEARK